MRARADKLRVPVLHGIDDKEKALRKLESTEGNLNLDPERSVQFEFGVKHQFTDDDAVDITLYNKDNYDYPTATQPREATRSRLIYVNSDFSRTRGIEVVYRHRSDRRVSGHLSYEYLIATGKPADPNRIRQVDPEALETGDAEPDLNEEFMPWNRPHRLQASLDLRFRRGDDERRVLASRGVV